MKKLFLLAFGTWFAVSAGAQLTFSTADEAAEQNTPSGWTAVQLPTGLPEITAANTFVITDAPYSASTSSEDNTSAIQAALDAAANAGGGMVVIPAGTFLSGYLTMGSKTILHLSAGATLKMLPISSFPTDGNGYHKMESPFITGKNKASDIVIEGESRETSIIDGQGAPWWDEVETAKAAGKTTTRAALIRFWKGERYLFRNLRIQNAPNTNITIGNGGDGANQTAHAITIINPSSHADDPSHNTDGFPIWTDHVNIYDCYIDTGDDNVVCDRYAQYVHVWDCEFLAGHGASFGSYTTGMHDIIYENLTLTGTDAGFRLKSNNDRSGDVYNIVFRNCTMTNVQNPISITCWYDSLPDPATVAKQDSTELTPAFHDITIKDVTISGHTDYLNSGKNGYGIFIYGRPESYVRDVTFDNVNLTHSKGLKLNYCDGIKFKNCSIAVSNTNKKDKNGASTEEELPALLIEEMYKGSYTWNNIVQANEAVIYWKDGTTSANTISVADGWSLTISGNAGKNWSAGNGDITYNGTTYKTLKNSNGAQNTLTLPEGQYASKVEFYAVSNADAAGKLSEFNGESCNDEVSSIKDYENPTHIAKNLTTPVNQFTFTFSGKQACFIMVVTHSSDNTKTCAEPEIAFGDWNDTESGFPVTITNNEDGATLSYAIGDGEYQAYSAPFYVGAEVTVHAKASKTNYNDAKVSAISPKHIDGGATATFAWTVGNESVATITSELDTYVKKTCVTTGTSLAVGTYSNYAANPGKTMTTYVPAVKGQNVPSVMIEYTVTMVKGTNFALKTLSYDALKVGTDASEPAYAWSYTVDGVESAITSVSRDDLLRDNNKNAESAQLNHQEAINAAAGQKVTVRFYVSGFDNTKTFALSNIQLVGEITGEPVGRTFKDFKLEFRDNPYTVLLPESGELPEGVTIEGTGYNGVQHGIYGGTITVPVDGAVKFIIGACQYSGSDITVKKDGEDYMTVSNIAPCGEQKPNYNQFVTWTYNAEESAVLSFVIPGNVFIPYFFAEQCEFIPSVEVNYYDVDGKTLIGSETVEGGSALAYKYGAADVTVADGKAFRGWFASADKTAAKIPEGTPLTEDLKLYAHATDIEVATVGAVFEYDLRQSYFYPEDHELLTITGGSYKDASHGWQFGTNGSVSVEVAGNALVKFNLCKYGNAGTLSCKDALNNAVGEPITLPVSSDGGTGVISYTGAATTLTFTLSNGGYIHSLKVFNIAEVPAKNAAGYYVLSANDGAGLLLLLETAQDGDIIFLPNGTYDFGNTTLTEINKSISLIGQSMEGVLIQNHPLNAGMNGSETLHLRSTNIYVQDLAIRCDVSYPGSIAGGVGIAVQDRGDKNIFKRVDLQGNQDTYLSSGHPTQRGWIEDCRIEGTVDYVCGGGNIWFENTLFYNNARSNADVIFAPNTDASTVYGYVLNNCTIDGADGQAGRWNLARGWQKSPAVTFLNTTCKIAPSTQGYTHMSADLVCRFHEYNTHMEDGTPITGHNLDGLNYSASSDAIYLENAGVYTYANVIKGDDNWDAQSIAADAVADQQNIDADAAYLVENEGAFVAVLKGLELSEQLVSLIGKTIRKANTRGGFGKAVKIEDTPSDIDNLTTNDQLPTTNKVIRDGQLFIIRDGKTYNVLGTMIE